MALCILPIELSHNIAGLLETDRDVCSYIAVCRQTYGTVGNEQSYIWRKRFEQHYDLVPNQSTGELALKYKVRRRVLRNGAVFKFGHEFPETLCLEIIKQLIIESFGQTSQTEGSELKPRSNNLKALRRFIQSTNLVHDIYRHPPERGIHNPLLITIQLLFTPWSLNQNPELALQTYSFAYSQKAVYAHPKDCPMFLDKYMRRINIEYVLHIANFFKYHMVRSEEHTLYQDVWMLAEDQKPKIWEEKLEDGTKPLGRYWKGSYAYPEDRFELIRRSEPTENIFIDVFENEAGFQTMELDFNPSFSDSDNEEFKKNIDSILSYHPSFNPHMKDQTAVNTKKRDGPSSATARHPKPHRLKFEGFGRDRDVFDCVGHLQALPPQQGIPGWQRITLMKYALDLHGFYDESSCWAYEGIVLPGRQIILGRWWSPLNDGGDGDVCGPFIFWNVRKVGEDGDSGSEAGQ